MGNLMGIGLGCLMEEWRKELAGMSETERRAHWKEFYRDIRNIAIGCLAGTAFAWGIALGMAPLFTLDNNREFEDFMRYSRGPQQYYNIGVYGSYRERIKDERGGIWNDAGQLRKNPKIPNLEFITVPNLKY